MNDHSEIRLWLRAFLPTWIAAAYAIVVLPRGPGPTFFELAPYQQIGSTGVTLSIIWSLYRVWKFGAGEEVTDA